ncbi:MAG: GNAT family N-acetyltransferase [Opitutaceae bacterium]|nr:GNAT family N-acetyltransferase [Opitutaceae bacterium]
MIIRDAVSSDSADIARLTNLLGYPGDAEAISYRLAKIAGRQEDLLIVAVLKEEIVGWLQAHASVVLESGFRVEIVGLIVSEESRRCGVGRSLVHRAEQWASQIGAEALVVRSNTKRVESHIFYPALGFSSSKTQSVYRRVLKTEPNQALQHNDRG